MVYLMLLSIIIPVFNVESYVDKCLESILRCDLGDCEVILVLGASSDESNNKCCYYAKKYENIHLVYQTGQGLANARNCGYDQCSGEYISYIDSDDYVDVKRYSQILSFLRTGEQFDLLVTDYSRVIEGYDGANYKEPMYQIGEIDAMMRGTNHLPDMLRKKQCFWNVWRYIYRKSFLEEHKIRFWENMLSEDLDYTTKVLLAEPQMFFWHCPYYVYRVGRADSLMGRVTAHRIEDTVQVLSTCIRALAASKLPYAPMLVDQYQFEFTLIMAQLCEVPQAEKEKLKTLFLSNLDVLSHGTGAVGRPVKCALKIFGLSLCSRALYGAKLIKRYVRKRKFISHQQNLRGMKTDRAVKR